MGPHVILTLVVVLPVAWLLSEFQPHRWLRIATGLGAIAMSFGVAAVFGSFERFNSNAWYGEASWNLIGTTIEEIESGETERLVRELKTLQEQFVPTYENRARYDELVREFLTRLGREEKRSPLFR